MKQEDKKKAGPIIIFYFSPWFVRLRSKYFCSQFPKEILTQTMICEAIRTSLGALGYSTQSSLQFTQFAKNPRNIPQFFSWLISWMVDGRWFCSNCNKYQRRGRERCGLFNFSNWRWLKFKLIHGNFQTISWFDEISNIFPISVLTKDHHIQSAWSGRLPNLKWKLTNTIFWYNKVEGREGRTLATI